MNAPQCDPALIRVYVKEFPSGDIQFVSSDGIYRATVSTTGLFPDLDVDEITPERMADLGLELTTDPRYVRAATHLIRVCYGEEDLIRK